ncbi:MAG: RNA polymerase sigma factor, partial [Gammaproteobacteria bacterium]|nr:RNA polymerase sigma factor [Gammaproteobacteria bacterium]
MGVDGLSDEALMLKYRDGDAHAFDVLYERHKGPLFRYCLRHCSERTTAEETYQDVWMRVIGARARYEPSAKFSTWLYRIARNRVIDLYRSDNPGQRVSLDDESSSIEPRAADTTDPARQVDSERIAARLDASIAELPAEQRDAFLLHEEAGLALEDIARVAGVGRETAKSRLRYALKKLRAAL